MPLAMQIVGWWLLVGCAMGLAALAVLTYQAVRAEFSGPGDPNG